MPDENADETPGPPDEGLATREFAKSLMQSRARQRRNLRIAAAAFAILVLLALGGMAAGVSQLQRVRDELCEHNLRKLALATSSFHDVCKRLPTKRRSGLGASGPVSWRVELLRFSNKQSVYDQYNPTLPWNSEANQRVAHEHPDLYLCPAAERAPGTAPTSYFAIEGPGALYEPGKFDRLSRITDSSAATLMYVESHGQDVVWTEPRDLKNAESLRTHHRDGANVVYADGSVGALSPDIDPVVLKALTTAAGGEQVERPETK